MSLLSTSRESGLQKRLDLARPRSSWLLREFLREVFREARTGRVICFFVCALALTAASAAGQSRVAADAQGSMTERRSGRDVLWHIVHDECVPEAEGKLSGTPHCVYVDLLEHYVIMKDTRGVAQLLFMPTELIPGIESPELLGPDAANFFQEAWDSRGYLAQFLHKSLPRDEVSLAINSEGGRTQDSLHIHIDCVREDVAKALREHGGEVKGQWAPFPVPLAGHPYLAMRIDGDLLSTNPFTLLADGIPGARGDMGERTLVLVGATFEGRYPGFILLEDHASGTDRASGEELQDHSCTIAN